MRCERVKELGSYGIRILQLENYKQVKEYYERTVAAAVCYAEATKVPQVRCRGLWRGLPERLEELIKGLRLYHEYYRRPPILARQLLDRMRLLPVNCLDVKVVCDFPLCEHMVIELSGCISQRELKRLFHP